jgi:cholesterol oxidase
MSESEYDWVIVGSGFGGSVSAHRLTEKGYRVLVLEKGRRFAAEDFPKTNWDLKRWMWNPAMGLKGIFKMTFMKHMTVLHGVGVGGGSLVYANTLPTPKSEFFESGSWAGLADWETELAPHYARSNAKPRRHQGRHRDRGNREGHRAREALSPHRSRRVFR